MSVAKFMPESIVGYFVVRVRYVVRKTFTFAVWWVSCNINAVTLAGNIMIIELWKVQMLWCDSHAFWVSRFPDLVRLFPELQVLVLVLMQGVDNTGSGPAYRPAGQLSDRDDAKTLQRDSRPAGLARCSAASSWHLGTVNGLYHRHSFSSSLTVVIIYSYCYIILCMCVCGIQQLIDCPSDKICRAVAIDCPLDASVPCIPRFVGHCVDPDGKASTAVSTAFAAIRFLLLSRYDYLRDRNTLTYLLTSLPPISAATKYQQVQQEWKGTENQCPQKTGGEWKSAKKIVPIMTDF